MRIRSNLVAEGSEAMPNLTSGLTNTGIFVVFLLVLVVAWVGMLRSITVLRSIEGQSLRVSGPLRKPTIFRTGDIRKSAMRLEIKFAVVFLFRSAQHYNLFPFLLVVPRHRSAEIEQVSKLIFCP